MIKEKALRIGFIGCGKMAQALAKGFIASGITRSENIIGSSPRVDSTFIEEFSAIGCSTTHENAQVVEQADVVIVATKPPLVPKVLTEINPVVNGDNLIVSIAMGIPLINLEQMLPRKTRVIRVMPNTPVLVRSGASVFSCGTSTRSGDATLTKRLFTAVGVCEEVPEVLIDACTGLSGSGPAYMYIAMEALADGGVKMGIPRDLAYKLSAQTLIGAAKMVLETGRHPGALKDDVCSPAGSTIQAVYFLEKSGFRSSLMEAVQAATLKSKQTGRKE
ncbi:pyrroline-5-carboxylate reductase 2-like [Daphnia carinata]|uniref:pyrroline-5-carboxylate reductase 2-like n=1 Tax=Daphnia carinata TaxID=120202 RepID=UPI00257C0A0F|nr:pyrroline-5-carboxylate reductase 2-like [Daphnia carinata]XP_057368762.1 pyrroline-5-carboxylate reductase 2-like [Daphnia carinata]